MHQLQLLDFQAFKRQPKRNVLLSESFGSRSLTSQNSGNSGESWQRMEEGGNRSVLQSLNHEGKLARCKA
jgi:hypothetical protein